MNFNKNIHITFIYKLNFVSSLRGTKNVKFKKKILGPNWKK